MTDSTSSSSRFIRSGFMDEDACIMIQTIVGLAVCGVLGLRRIRALSDDRDLERYSLQRISELIVHDSFSWSIKPGSCRSYES